MSTNKDEDVMGVAVRVLQRANLAADMASLGRGVGEFYNELKATIEDPDEAFSMTVQLMSDFVQMALIREAHTEDNEEEDAEEV